jgi:hypothetical protein
MVCVPGEEAGLTERLVLYPIVTVGTETDVVTVGRDGDGDREIVPVFVLGVVVDFCEAFTAHQIMPPTTTIVRATCQWAIRSPIKINITTQPITFCITALLKTTDQIKLLFLH